MTSSNPAPSKPSASACGRSGFASPPCDNSSSDAHANYGSRAPPCGGARLVTPVRTALIRASMLLPARFSVLAARAEGGDDSVWPDILATVQTLAQLAPVVAPGAPGQLLTTGQLAEAMSISTRQVRRLKAAGKIAPAAKLGTRTLRWRS